MNYLIQFGATKGKKTNNVTVEGFKLQTHIWLVLELFIVANCTAASSHFTCAICYHQLRSVNLMLKMASFTHLFFKPNLHIVCINYYNKMWWCVTISCMYRPFTSANESKQAPPKVMGFPSISFLCMLHPLRPCLFSNPSL